MFKKKVEFKKRVPTEAWLVICAVIFIALAIMTRENWLYCVVILAIGALFIKRYFFGKLILSAEDLVLFWGLPGSGKTLMLTKLAYDNRDKWYIGVNEEFEHLKLKDYVYKRDDMAAYNFPRSVMLFDEASLNGFDNRDFAKNFKDPGMLEHHKKHRQTETPIAYSNQGFEECDLKIRSYLANKVYYVENMGLWCRATIMLKDVTISEIDGKPIEGFRFPTVMERIMDPSLVLYAIPEFYGRFYSTKSPPRRLVFPKLEDARQLRSLKR